MITHKVVHKILFRYNNTEIVNERGAWEDFNSANQQAISCADSLKQNGSVEVHELIPGTVVTKKIVVRYVVEFNDVDGPHIVPIRKRNQRIEIPPP